MAEAEKATKREAERAREQEKTTLRHDWITARGTESQRERLAAGLLANDEIDASIEQELFAPLDSCPRYEKLRAADLPADSDSANCTTEHDADFSALDTGSVTAEVWEAAKTLRALLPPDAVSVIRCHYGWCDRPDCEARCERYGLRITLPHGVLTYIREYAL